MSPAPLRSERQQPQDRACCNRASPQRPDPVQLSDLLLRCGRLAQVRERLAGWDGDTEKLAEGLPSLFDIEHKESVGGDRLLNRLIVLAKDTQGVLALADASVKCPLPDHIVDELESLPHAKHPQAQK